MNTALYHYVHHPMVYKSGTRCKRYGRYKINVNVCDDALAATVSKVLSNSCCFPFENLKILYQTHKNPLIHVSSETLLKGFGCFLAYSCIHSFTYFQVFVFMQTLCRSNMHLATVATSILVSFYKLPVQFYLRNIVANNSVVWTKLLNVQSLCTKYTVMVLEDIPDNALKWYLYMFFSKQNSKLGISASLLIGIICTVIMTPMDMLKTHVLCTTEKTKEDNQYIFFILLLRMFTNVINTSLFMFLYEFFRNININISIETVACCLRVYVNVLMLLI